MICICGKKFYLHPKDTIGPPEKGASLVHSCSTIEVHSLGLRRFYQGEAVKNAQIDHPIVETSNVAPPSQKTPQIADKVAKTPKRKLSRIFLSAPLKNGRLELDRKSLAEQLSNLEDCTANILIEREENKKTNPQLGYLFGVVLKIISDDTGHTTEELYRDFFLGEYAPKKVLRVKNKEVISPKHASEMTSTEMMDFIERIVVWASQNWYIIPLPDKNYLWSEMPEVIEQNN